MAKISGKFLAIIIAAWTGCLVITAFFHLLLLAPQAKLKEDLARQLAQKKESCKFLAEAATDEFQVKQKEQIETIAQNILTIRTEFEGASLADLYNPLTMPPKLLKAHETLDKAVDKLYSKTGFKTDTERVAHLFELNKKLTSLIVEDKPKKRGKK